MQLKKRPGYTKSGVDVYDLESHVMIVATIATRLMLS